MATVSTVSTKEQSGEGSNGTEKVSLEQLQSQEGLTAEEAQTRLGEHF